VCLGLSLRTGSTPVRLDLTHGLAQPWAAIRLMVIRHAPRFCVPMESVFRRAPVVGAEEVPQPQVAALAEESWGGGS
jgi:hypothetical protein